MSDIDARQWVQPLFMEYDVDTDQMLPLTMERFEALKAVERQYYYMIDWIRTQHIAFQGSLGRAANVSWEPIKSGLAE